MDQQIDIPDNRTYIPGITTARGAIFLIGLVIMLGIGLALASPAHGARLSQTGKGDIIGTVTVNGQSAAGIAVELRQRTNGGTDATLASAKTDATGTYHFAGQPSAPNDAFYYVRFTGAKGDLAAWYSFPIIYTFGSEVTVPGVELADVELVAPGPEVSLALPGSLRWKARKMGETYRVFVYAAGKNDKAVLDSGSLGTGTEFPIPEGGLPVGKYEAMVQVRDVVAGYGQSQARFRFTIGSPSDAGVTAAPGGPEPAAPPKSQATSEDIQKGQATEPPSGATGATGAQDAQPKEQEKAKPDLKVNLSADKTAVGAGDSIVYKLEVENAGDGQATGVMLTDKLPAGASVDTTRVKAGSGQVSVESGTVKVNVGDLAAGAKTTVEIPVSVNPQVGSNLSNQASATYKEAAEPVQSNAYIAQVAAALSGPPASQPQQPAAPEKAPAKAPVVNPPAGQSQSQAQSQPQSQPKSEPKSQPQQPPSLPSGAHPQQPQAVAPAPAASSAPKANPAEGTQARPATAPPKNPAAAVPQTGGAFPVVFAAILVLLTLLARYLRGLTYRRT